MLRGVRRATLRRPRASAGSFAPRANPTSNPCSAHAERDPAWFWGAAIDDLGFSWQRKPRGVLDLSRGVEWSRWWTGGAFNYASAAIDPRAAANPGSAALTWEGEDGTVRRMTNAELRDEVNRAAAMFARLGVAEGDRVGIFLPLLPETVISVLALGKLKAIYIPIFSGYAAPAVASRLDDAGATLLVTADGTYRRGSKVPMKEIADDAVAQSATVKTVLVVGRLSPLAPQDNWIEGRDRWWSTEMADAGLVPLTDTPETDPETPYMIIYTSGTTGRPKGAVHVHGGFPIKGAQDLAHCFDLGPGDSLFWFTDLGWMMGPWAISGALLLGAELVLYEGAPDYPAPDRLWEIVARHRVTHLGLSPTVIRALMAHGTAPLHEHDLSSLRVLGSTGEPWNPESWWWFFNNVGGGRLPLVNYSGGTEVSGGIVCCNLLTPIKPTSFGGPSVGAAADVIDADGNSFAARSVSSSCVSPAGYDTRLLAGPRAVPGDLLVADSGHLGARRLGNRRRGRLLVHPGPLGRHAQGCRQASRPGRGGERRRCPQSGAGGGRCRCAARGQGRGRSSSSFGCGPARRTTSTCAGRLATR